MIFMRYTPLVLELWLVGINYNKSFRLATNDFLKKNLRDTLAFVSLVSLGHYRGQVYVLN